MTRFLNFVWAAAMTAALVLFMIWLGRRVPVISGFVDTALRG